MTFNELEHWKGLLDTPMLPKPDETSQARLAAQVLLDGRDAIRDAITGLEERLSHLRTGTA